MYTSVAYATPKRQFWETVQAPDGTTAREIIEICGVLEEFGEIELEKCRIGIFGKIVKPDYPVADGDRIEIYRALQGDPNEIKKRRAELMAKSDE
jgi:putative ubiquitin-RnfH superfamily antitoxin RatB of RatAB toxin-antitoxin module